MTQNPLFNAAGAFVYIVLVVLGIAHFVEPGPDTILIPMAMLALFVLSACVMGYIFLYQPTLLFIAGEHTKAVTLFLHTVGIFAVLTLVLFVAMFAFAP